MWAQGAFGSCDARKRCFTTVKKTCTRVPHPHVHPPLRHVTSAKLHQIKIHLFAYSTLWIKIKVQNKTMTKSGLVHC